MKPLSVKENKSARIYLKKGRLRSLQNYHPWVYSGAIDRIEGQFQEGDIVSVFSSDRKFQAKGFINSKSQIRIRILSFENIPITTDFFVDRLKQAYGFRQKKIARYTTAYRIVHGEGDFLPGLVVDKYGDAIVVQIFSMGMSRLRYHLINWIAEIIQPQIIIERSESRVLVEEGMQPYKEILLGKLENNKMIEENGIKYIVDIWNGQKTGFYLDQRDNRRRIGNLAAGKTLLNCFSYSGGFSLAAARNGAKTCSVDISEEANKLSEQNFRLNHLNTSEHQFIKANVFEFLKNMPVIFDFIVLDPPAFVKKKSHLSQGSRAYKEINRLAIQQIKPNGLILTCSCSSHIDWSLFQKIIYSAAKDNKREVQVIGKYGQPLDHPISIFHPESEYLKSLLLHVL